MGKLNITVGDTSGMPEIKTILEGKTPLQIGAWYNTFLESAEDKTVIRVPALPLAEKISDNFSAYTQVERTILTYLREHEETEEVTIVCPDEETVTFGMVVYNYWFPGEKSERLNNGKWD